MAANPAEQKSNGPNGRYNGRINGVEGKSPFLIGVAGGTASGKVWLNVIYSNIMLWLIRLRWDLQMFLTQFLLSLQVFSPVELKESILFFAVDSV